MIEEQTTQLLFEDSMQDNWQDHWFLDGQNAVVEHCENGLAFLTTASSVDKNIDREAFDAQHANLWTRQEFEGELRISYTYDLLPDSTYQTLIYIQARGIGEGIYEQDIYAWRKEREVARMDKYFRYMDLISLSLRNEIRCKRYPTTDLGGNRIPMEFTPRGTNKGMPNGCTYDVVIEKRKTSLSLQIVNSDTGDTPVHHTWDLTQITEGRDPEYVSGGRIGIRQMGGQRTILRDFKVEQL